MIGNRRPMGRICDDIGRKFPEYLGAPMLSLMLLRWSKLAVAVMTAVVLLQTGAQAQSFRQGVVGVQPPGLRAGVAGLHSAGRAGQSFGAGLSRLHVRDRPRRSAELYRSRDVVSPRGGAGRQPRAIFARPALRPRAGRAARYRRGQQMAQSLDGGGAAPARGRRAPAFAMP